LLSRDAQRSESKGVFRSSGAAGKDAPLDALPFGPRLSKVPASLLIRELCVAPALMVLMVIGCGSSNAPAGVSLSAETQPATAPSAQTFQDPGGLVRIQYSPDWTQKKDPDYVLSLASGSQLFTLDIPDLPPHVPGMIPLGLVVNGYIDDFKKSHPGVKTSEETAPSIPHARARRVLSNWMEKNVATSEVATLIVHGDHVFILRIVAPSDQLAAARIVYNAIVDSLHWLK
jgi:hypothetical protein